jgi:heat shock protein HtpX
MRPWTKVSPNQFYFGSLTIARLSLEVWLFLALIALLQLFVGYHFGGRTGLFAGLMTAIGLNILIFYFSNAQLLSKYQAVELQGQDAWGLLELAKKYARNVGVQMPHMYLMNHSTPIAFSLGQSWHRASICLSTGLLEKLSPEEVDAVMAHQICHVRRMGTFAFGASSALANALSGLSVILDNMWPPNWREDAPRQRPFVNLISPLAWLLIRLAISDKNYFENDDLAASLVARRHALASALWKIESYCQTQPLQTLPCTHHLFIVNPEGLKEHNWFFLTHPKLEMRIRRLIGTYPL